jgi:hypothetical protein
MAEHVVCASAIMTPQKVAYETERLIAEALHHRRQRKMRNGVRVSALCLTTLENVTLSAHSAFRTSEASDNLIGAALDHCRRIAASRR